MNKYFKIIFHHAKKLALLDYVFIGIFLSVVLAFFVFFKRSTVYIPITLKITDDNVLLADSSPKIDYAQSFIIGDTERNELGQPTATITNIDSYYISPNKQIVFVTIKAKAVYNARKKQYVVKSRPVVYGASIPFIFKNVIFTGLVVNFPNFETAQQVKRGATKVKAQLRYDSRDFSDISGVPNFIATSVKEGDLITNTNNEVMAKILSVEIYPAKRTVITSAGVAMNIQDPNLYDVFYTIDLTTKQINNKTYMFDYFPVLVGESIPLNFPTVSVYPTIIEILK